MRLASLNLGFPMCLMGTKIAPVSWGCWENSVRWSTHSAWLRAEARNVAQMFAEHLPGAKRHTQNEAGQAGPLWEFKGKQVNAYNKISSEVCRSGKAGGRGV